MAVLIRQYYHETGMSLQIDGFDLGAESFLLHGFQVGNGCCALISKGVQLRSEVNPGRRRPKPDPSFEV